MPPVVSFTAPRQVEVVDEPVTPLGAGEVRVATLYSGISAGTELTAFRGTNPYLTKAWDSSRRLFVDGEPSFAYPVTGWGYQEVGRVVERADDVAAPLVGQLVYGIWGHRADAVLPADVAARRIMPDGVPPEWGVFARVGAIALNAVVAADIHVGEHVAVFGQGVIGVLATRLATLNGAAVTAVDAKPGRLDLARGFGAVTVLDARSPDGVAETVRAGTDGAGADTAIELSGSYAALQEAVRTVRPEGRVVAAGFYQGDAVGLRLGEEFHHNRVEIVASQIGGAPRGRTGQWDHDRLLRVFMTLVAERRVDVAPLISHVLEVGRVGEAFRLLDRQSDDALQVILRFDEVEGEAR